MEHTPPNGPELVASSNETTLNATRADVETQLEGIGGLQGALLLVRRLNERRINDAGRAFLAMVETIARDPSTEVVVEVRTRGNPALDGKVARVVIGA